MKKCLFIIVFVVFLIFSMTACDKEKGFVNISFETNGGAEISDMEVSEDTISLSLPVPIKNGYNFENWYLDGEFETEATLENILNLEVRNVVVYANWTKNINTLVFHPNGGQGQMDDMRIETGESVSLSQNEFVKEGYVFAGWSEIRDGEIVYQAQGSYTMGEDSEYIIYAVWVEAYTINFEASGGQGQMQSLITGENLQVSLPENEFVKQGHVFYGWAVTQVGEKVYENGQTFVMPDEDLTLYALWADVSLFIEIIDENSFYFGEYPQTVASEQEVLQMTDQPNSEGYYISGDDRFVKVIASPKNTLGETGSIFQNQQEIIFSEEYFFKVEPIKWRILEEDEGKYFVVADLVLDMGAFGQSNDWANSDIRDWLNEEFLTKAFDEYESLIINKNQNTTYYWEWQGEEMQQSSTTEKVFLLSYNEIIKSEYGFGDSQERVGYVSDYAKALGVWTGAGELNDPPNPSWQIHTGMYFLRSGALHYKQGRADSLRYHGGAEGVNAEDELGIRPAMVINKY